MKETVEMTRTVARRLAIVAQGLAGPRPGADTEGIMEVVGRLGCLQLDPINVVARSHLLVLWSRLFDFSYQSEIYTPKDKRRFGYYVMPILSGDQLIGRIDPVFDRARKQLIINAVHTEPATAITRETGQAIAGAIEELAAFLGATTISYSHRLPEGWKHICLARKMNREILFRLSLL